MSLALYRKYRPGTFAEVVGQEHVTEPLQTALRTGRIHHAYLFSGPRGCGKTSSARILARSLNCAKGPTPTPCGECDSCVALAPNGPGSLDVIEIDAASHGLVDDARDLRERAFFAPVSSPFKIYIIDEAHMISPAAFNALLKVVEEPPPHVKFIFATTEPEKVLSTIKSRTFHYRFRLIPPAVLREFLAGLCAREGIEVDPLVLPLVVRAGAGSARDALSVLDQLAAGSEEGGITYERALSILGYTDAALLDETVDAFTAGDGASVFRAVDRVIEAGIDPRRFAQDLLERFRDLVVLDAVADAGDSGLLDLPADTVDRMRGQASRFGRASLTRAGDVMAQSLVDMRGTTSPRLVLELACARVLLPGAESDIGGLLARLDRLERRLAVTGVAAPEPVIPATAAPPPSTASTVPSGHVPPPASPAVSAPEVAPAVAAEPPPGPPRPAPVPLNAAAVTDQPVAAPVTAPGGLDLPGVRRLWPELLDVVNARNKTANALLRNAEPQAVDAKSVTVSFSTGALAKMFTDKSDFLREALRELIGVDLKVLVTVGGGAPAPAAPGGGEPDTRRGPGSDSGRRSGAEPGDYEPGHQVPLRPEPGPRESGRPEPARHELDPEAHPDADLEDSGAEAEPSAEEHDPVRLLQRDLGAQVIGELDDA